GQIVSHAYAEAGDYTVTLTVTDDQAGTSEITKQVSVVHADPTAQFDVSSSARTVAVDAGGSAATDGASLAYKWDWGDGTATSDGENATHVYADDGNYEITLSVTDSLGSTHSTTQSISVTEEVFAGSDAFERTVSTGWGAADVGGAWTSTGWNSATVSVGDGAGKLALSPGAGRDLVLGGTSFSESASEMTYSVAAGPSTGSLYVGLKSRYDDGHAYRSAVWHRADGTMWLLVQRDDAVIATLPLTGQQWAAGDTFHLRTEVVGESSPTIRVKVWADGLAEPSGWQLETTDSSASALTGPGSSAVYLYRSGSATGQNVISVDDYRLQDRGENGVPPANSAPTASFVSTPSGLSLAVDGSTSSDPDGTIESFEWDFGDGATATGATATHEYAGAGAYTVTLTVTDDDGATHSATKSVTVTEQVFAGSDAFERTVSNGWGAADVGGAWTSTGWNSGTVSVDDGAGRLALSPGAGRDLVLGGTSLSESGSAMTYSVAAGPSTGSLYVGLKSRYDDGSAYRSAVWHRADGTMWLLVQRDDAVLATLPLSGQQWAAGDVFHLRTEVVGGSSPTIRVKVWAEGSAEPSGWQLETTDTSALALAGPGSSAVYLYRSGSATGQNVISVDDYRLQDGGGQAPVARKAAIAPPAELTPETEPVIEKQVVPDADQSTTKDAVPDKDSESAPDRSSDAGPEPSPAGDTPAKAGEGAASDDEPAEEPATKSENASEAEPVPAEESSSEDGAQEGESEEAQDAGDSPEADDEAGGTDAEGTADGDQDSKEKAADDEDPATSGGADADDADNAAEEADATDPDEASATADEDPTEDSTMPTGTPVVQDDFDRSSDTGWGDAEQGGTWSLAEALAPSAGVADGAAALDLPAGESGDALLDETSFSQSTVDLTFRVDAAEGAVDGEVGVVTRATEDSQYSVRAVILPDGTMQLNVLNGEKVVTTQKLDGMAFSPDASYTLRVSVTGSSPTTISAKLWEVGADEPEDWQLTTADDTSSLQGEGALGLVAENVGGVDQLGVRFEEFVVVSGD
ncbi:PKD domain-containing protein, partial [Brachybacterium sp. 107]